MPAPRLSLYPRFVEGDVAGGHEAIRTATGLELTPVFSARSALVAALRALGLGRMDEVLVPPYLGQCVISALARSAFPTMTASSRTRAVLVFHQFGFLQDMQALEDTARRNGWALLNDCAHTLLSSRGGRLAPDWGDAAVVSYAKLFPCGLGGGLALRTCGPGPVMDDQDLAEALFERFTEASNTPQGKAGQLAMEAVYGALPLVLCPSRRAEAALPASPDAIRADADARRRILETARQMLGPRVPQGDDDVVPFAVPVAGDTAALHHLSQRIGIECGAEAPVLHFDFARNMLSPDYRPALVIGCHAGWADGPAYAALELLRETLA